jgi:predicted kinase
MARICLTGPAGAGKTTLATYLKRERNYLLLDYSAILKGLAYCALRAAGVSLKYEDLRTPGKKERYRPFLQELGTLVGFNEGAHVDDILDEFWREGSPENAVFDNARFDAQFDKLRQHGFHLVRFIDTANVIPNRISQVNGADHEAERGLSPYAGEIHVEAGWPTDVQANFIEDKVRALEHRQC